jgi:iron uptake system component EfeO
LGSGLQTASGNPLVNDAVEQYSEYVVEQAGQAREQTRELTDAVRAGDLQAAKAAYAPARVPWERIEPIAGLVEELDGKLDARVDDFAGVDDPEFTGYHRLEHILFERNTTEGATQFADQLDQDLATLENELRTLQVPAAAVPVGASELIEEVSLGKITGEENRYAKTDLWDIAANINGSQQAIEYLNPALEQADPALAEEIATSFDELDATLEPLRASDGWVLYCRQDDQFPSDRCAEVTVDPATVDQLTAQTAALSEQTSKVAGALDLGQ